MITARNRRTDATYTFRTNDVDIAAERLGRKLRVTMLRVTGGTGLSGIFQGYRTFGKRGTLSAVGDQFHIR